MGPGIQHVLDFGKVDSAFHILHTPLSVAGGAPCNQALACSSGNTGLLP